MITRKDISAHLERVVRTGFLAGTKAYTPKRSAFTRTVSSSAAFELHADFGTPPWPTQNAGKAGAAGVDERTGAQVTNQISAGASIRIMGGQERSLLVYNIDWEIAVGITHNAINDDQIGDLEAWARGAAVNYEKHKDYLCFDALNQGADTTTYPYGKCYDGLAMISASHVDPGAEYQTAQDNEYALALTLDNFETVRVAGSNFLDDRGKPGGLSHNLLIVPTAYERIAAQITGNPEDYETANRAANPYAGTTRYMVAPGGWIDSTSWFLVDDSMPEKPINLQERQTPQLAVWDDEKTGDGGTRYFKWHSRYAVFYGDWRLLLQGNT